MGILSYY